MVERMEKLMDKQIDGYNFYSIGQGIKSEFRPGKCLNPDYFREILAAEMIEWDLVNLQAICQKLIFPLQVLNKNH